MSRFLIAASALAVTTLVQGANWIPTSPLVQIGNDCDIYFDSAAGLEVTDNLYSSATKTSATNWTVTPGFLLEYGKDSALSVNLSAKRTFVNFTDAALSDLEDSRDALSAAIRFADGGPLSLTVDSSYRVTARNDELIQNGADGALLGATLVRQANYAHSFRADYKFTEKLSVGLGYTNTYNHYLNPTKVNSAAVGSPAVFNYNTNSLTELDTKSIPLSFDYQAFEKLSFGLVLQHDVSDYSAAPYFSDNIPVKQPLLHKQLVKDFAGLTLKGQLTESGKLNGNIRVGYSQFHFDSLANDSDFSYSVSLSHSLTERISQSLTLSRDVNASSTGSQVSSKNYTYGLSYTAAEDLSFNLAATKSDVLSGTTPVNTYVYTLGADFKYSNHLSFQAGYNMTDSSSSTAASTFTSNTFTLSAAFRY
jgi:hypothetical protein